jgi:hypothetical protein
MIEYDGHVLRSRCPYVYDACKALVVAGDECMNC